jgi:DNA polymerase (family 10)
MDRKDVAQVLEEIGSLLELKSENPFRVRAYRTAARAILGFPGDLADALSSGELAAVKGIGPATLELVKELLETGHSTLLESLRDDMPAALAEMLKISGLGVTKIRQIWEILHIDSIEELEEAAKDGRLEKLPRFGKKTAENVLKGISFLRQVSEFRLFHHARAEAAAMAKVLAAMPEVTQAIVVGSVRRRREVIRDLDFVVEVRGTPTALFDRLGSAPGVTEFVGKTEVSATLRFATGTVADIYATGPDQLGFQLVRSTGSEEHLRALAALAASRGLEWTDEGLKKDGKTLPLPREEDVYQALGLSFIPPELREARGEVEAAAAGKLPKLVEERDIKGFLHCHSNYSDGTSTVRDWAVAGRSAGYAYVGITDHSQAAAYAGGLAEEDIGRQHLEIDAVNLEFSDIRILKGVEADILEDGSLDYTPEVRARFDFIIASVHSRFGMNAQQMTDRILKAMDDPRMAIMGHPTGRLLLSRDPYPLDLDAIFRRAAERQVAMEINADPQRLDLDWTLVRQAADAGVTISIGADAHSTNGIGNIELGVGIARKGWLTKSQVLNTRSLDKFLDHVEKKGTSS